MRIERSESSRNANQAIGCWYLAYCKARQEDLAAQGLTEQGYRVYLPKLSIKRRRSGGARQIEEPLFPRYLFVGTAFAEQALAAIGHTRGVRKLVRFGLYPLPVMAEVVEAIREREDPETGFHRLELAGLKPGTPVRIKSGALAGLSGVFTQQSGNDRALLLLDILGQQAQASVQLADLER